jgi:ParB family chromosome partitioning protein
MAIKTQDLNARLFGKADKRRATTAAEAQQAVKEKTSVIELTIAGEQQASFELVSILPEQIATKTRVFKHNAREQAFLNEHALADILTTLKTQGQQYPAVGRWSDNDTIEVLDGSRRRMACLLAEKPFLIYVAKDIQENQAKFLSDVANAHKPLSLFERGKEMQFLLDNKTVLDQKELAKYCQCSEALVSGALKAASLPLALLTAYPSVGELGRPTIVKLHRLFFSLTPELQLKFISMLGENSEPLWQRIHVQGIARITREVTIQLEVICASLLPSPLNQKAKAQELVKGRVMALRENDKLQLKLSKVSDDDMDEILAYITEYFS